MGELIGLLLFITVVIFVPIVWFGILFFRNKENRLGIAVAFLLGIILYIVVQWGIIKHGLQYLFESTQLYDWMIKRYIWYLLFVNSVSAILATVFAWVVFHFIKRKYFTYDKACAVAIGFGMAEAICLVGYQNIKQFIVHWSDGIWKETVTSSDLYLASFERILYLLLYVTLMTGLGYFVKEKMFVLGGILSSIVFFLIWFMPAFFLAFTLQDYFELFQRESALLFGYAFLSVFAIAGGALNKFIKAYY